MKSSNFGRSLRGLRTPSAKRRPTGISRRQKKQLGFETLEDRRVMSAESPLAQLAGNVDESVKIEVTSLSSNTAEGALQILLNELNWASLVEASTQSSIASFSIPTDPLLGDQWHLINIGQEVGNPDFQAIFGIPGEDINVAPVFNNTSLTGAGVTVAVIDSALQFDHPDLAANVSATLGLSTFTGTTGPALGTSAPHGTAVAGLIGAVANNGLGGSGIAPGVTLVPIEFLDFFGNGNPAPNATVDAFRYETDQIDITNNSWGPRFDLDGDGVFERGLRNLTEAEVFALRDSIIFGRGGLGVVHVFASGNGAGSPLDPGFNSLGNWGSAGYNGWVNSRYTIGVTGVDHDGFYNNIDGTVTSFAEAGTSVLVAAPTGSAGEFNTPINIGGDSGLGSGIITTDLTGEAGFNISPDPITGQEFDRDFLTDIDYTSRFGGTSAADPLVSGVVALMLEANPNLSWRDVQEILVRSARQNAEFETPNTVITGPTQNTWIINQMPVFHDPDPFDPAISPEILTRNPTLDPTIVSHLGAGFSDNHFQPTPQVLTNSAGFTVSQGKGVHGEQIGTAHGVVDAELAVLMAQQWHTKNQALPNELTFTSFINPAGGFFIPLEAQEQSDEDSLFQVVPGGLGGTLGGGFVDYWEEYFADDPFSDYTDTEVRGGFIELSVPSTNDMTIENVEVKITATGGTSEFLDSVRVLLVSPDGTHHDLNHFFLETPPSLNNFPINANASSFRESPALASSDTDPGNPLVATFSSNRSWGERSDNAIIFDPITAEPAAGIILSQGWQLHMENYSNTAFQITGIEVDWHGSPIAVANTQRIQGLIGVDDNEDDQFNFSRVQLINADVDGVVRFREVANVITAHESMGANVTVFAHRDANGNGVLDATDVLVDQFVTGADGNYYFDLVPDDYIISVEDPLGRTVLDDSITPGGFLKDYQSQWNVTTDFFKVWDYDANLEVPLQAATNAPFSFSGTAIPDHVKHINFLLDPGPPAAPQVDFSGSIFADLNGDGLFNGDDVAVPGVGVFGDVNRNGALDAGEILVESNAAGEYALTILDVTTTTVMNVGVRPPASWTASNPSAGFEAFFVQPGDTFTGVDFHIQPPSGATAGDGSALSGIILGTIFNDSNGNMLREAGEVGVPNITVYVDMNNSGAIDAGDVVTTTNSNGAYAFADLPDGGHFLRMELDPLSGITQTFPDFDLPQFATIVSGGTVTDIKFGVSSGSGGPGGTLDFGDLPDVYGTRLVDDGPRHPEGIFFLGTMIDAEPDGKPTSDALGDDTAFIPDEDGIAVDALVAGGLGRLEAVASRHGGYLQGWVDFNGDGDFDDLIGGVSEKIVTNALLVPGVNVVNFAIPTTIDATTVYARFRYGEFGLGSTGLASIGEVEDYVLTVAPPVVPQVIIHGPDFNEDGQVNGFDFLAWQRGVGTTTGATAADGDSDSDGDVDAADLVAWEQDFGTGGSSVPAVLETGDFDLDGDADGFDFLAWQRGEGTVAGAAISDGDGNQDGQVNATDLAIWETNYGYDATGSSAPLSGISSTGPSGSRTASPVASEFAASTVPSLATEQTSVVEQNASGIPNDRALRSLAMEVQHRFEGIQQRFERVAVRLENVVAETSHDHSIDLTDLGFAMRDRALDRLFAKRDRLFDNLSDKDYVENHAQDAFEAVFDQEQLWRFA